MLDHAEELETSMSRLRAAMRNRGACQKNLHIVQERESTSLGSRAVRWKLGSELLSQGSTSDTGEPYPSLRQLVSLLTPPDPVSTADVASAVPQSGNLMADLIESSERFQSSLDALQFSKETLVGGVAPTQSSASPELTPLPDPADVPTPSKFLSKIILSDLEAPGDVFDGAWGTSSSLFDRLRQTDSLDNVPPSLLVGANDGALGHVQALGLQSSQEACRQVDAAAPSNCNPNVGVKHSVRSGEDKAAYDLLDSEGDVVRTLQGVHFDDIASLAGGDVGGRRRSRSQEGCLDGTGDSSVFSHDVGIEGHSRPLERSVPSTVCRSSVASRNFSCPTDSMDAIMAASCLPAAEWIDPFDSIFVESKESLDVQQSVRLSTPLPLPAPGGSGLSTTSAWNPSTMAPVPRAACRQPSAMSAASVLPVAQPERSAGSGAWPTIGPPEELVPHLAFRLSAEALKAWIEDARRQFQWADENHSGLVSGVEVVQLCRQLRYARGGPPIAYAMVATLLTRFVSRDDERLGLVDFWRFAALVDLITNEDAFLNDTGALPPASSLHPVQALRLPTRASAFACFGAVSPLGSSTIHSQKRQGSMRSPRVLQVSKSKLGVPLDFARGELLRSRLLPGGKDWPLARRLVALLEDDDNLYLVQECSVVLRGSHVHSGSGMPPRDLAEFWTDVQTAATSRILSWWAAHIVLQLLKAVGHLNGCGVLHLGICAASVILCGRLAHWEASGGLANVAMLADEGLGGLATEVTPALEAHLGWNSPRAGRQLVRTRETSCPATPVARFAAPELAMGKPTFASDLFSVGCILNLLLVGQLPGLAVTRDVARNVENTDDGSALGAVVGLAEAWGHPLELVSLGRSLLQSSPTCRPSVTSAKEVAALIVASYETLPVGTLTQDSRLVENLVARWRAFGVEELRRRSALLRLASAASDELGAAQGVKAALGAAAGVLSADPVALEPATPAFVGRLIGQSLELEVRRRPMLGDVIWEVCAALVPLPPPPLVPNVGFDVDPPLRPLTGSVVLMALQAILDANEFRLGADRGNKGRLLSTDAGLQLVGTAQGKGSLASAMTAPAFAMTAPSLASRCVHVHVATVR